MTTSESAPPRESVSVRRERRRSQRRDRVYAAAVTLFTERGYDGTTMDDIAVRADVARTSVFNYFERKSAFLDDWAARRRALAFAGVADGEAPLAARLTQFMTVLAETSTDSRAETVAMFGPAVRELNLLDNSALAGELAELIRQAGPEAIADGIDPILVALTLATGYFAVLQAWCKSDPAPFDLGDRLRQLVLLVAGGMTAT